MECLLCGSKKKHETIVGSAYRCKKCGAVFGSCYKGDSYSIVKPYFAEEHVPVESLRYYDLEVVGSNGVERRHGWFDPATKLIHQTG
jgi:hypothetical protein